MGSKNERTLIILKNARGYNLEELSIYKKEKEILVECISCGELSEVFCGMMWKPRVLVMSLCFIVFTFHAYC